MNPNRTDEQYRDGGSASQLDLRLLEMGIRHFEQRVFI